MNRLNINHVKVEKANAIGLRYRKIRKITNFFRVFEIFLVVAVISRISFNLPIALAFEISNAYIHNLALILVSPQFVFVIGNAIVITLFVSSGKLNNNNTPCNVVKRPKYPPTHQHKRSIKPLLEPRKPRGVTEENMTIAAIFPAQEAPAIKIYHRSKSEMPTREKMEKGCCRLRRSNTEIRSLKGCGSVGCCRDAGKGHYPEDHMSNEEFKKTIEEFIAKQQRFLREEEDFSILDENFEEILEDNFG